MVWSILKSLWSRSPHLPLPQVVLYTRAGCHLCEDAWKILNHVRTQIPFDLTSHDIADDSSLTALYGNVIPVVTVNGQVRFRGHVNAVLLRRLLRAQ